MATAEQLKSLIRSHFENDNDQFSTVALQLAAHEARGGHAALAHDIRTLIEHSKTRQIRVIPFRRELDDLILASEPTVRMSDLIVPREIRDRIARILREFQQKHKLHKHGLENRRKLLLTGPPGTGKTLTANVIAGELALPLFAVLMDKIVTKFMGETGAKLRQIFTSISERRGVYLFDEFDAIGAERARDDDVGEMRRVLNAFLQFIEHDKSDSVIIAATNNRISSIGPSFAALTTYYAINFPHPPKSSSSSRIVLGRFVHRSFQSSPLQETLPHCVMPRSPRRAMTP